MDVTFAVDASGLSGYLEQKIEALRAPIMAKLDAANGRLQVRIQQKVTGELLQQRTGKLARSIEMIPAAVNGDVIEGAVQGGGGTALYAKFQEYGTSGPYEIAPNKVKALAFMLNGKIAFAKRVVHPGLPARSFMRSTFQEMQPEIVAELQAVPREIQ